MVNNLSKTQLITMNVLREIRSISTGCVKERIKKLGNTIFRPVTGSKG